MGDWPCVLEQLLPALGPPGMREQAAHQDFYGNLLLETATAATAARGLPAAGAAAAEAPRPLPTPQCRTRTASLRATRTLACLRLPAGERSRGARGRGRGRRRCRVSRRGRGLQGDAPRAAAPGPAPPRNPSVSGSLQLRPRARRGLGGVRSRVSLAVRLRGRFPCFAPLLWLPLRPVGRVLGAFSTPAGEEPSVSGGGASPLGARQVKYRVIPHHVPLARSRSPPAVSVIFKRNHS